MIIQYEDRTIYDGWCATYDTETGEVELRDAWFLERLSDERKAEIIEDVKQAFKD